MKPFANPFACPDETVSVVRPPGRVASAVLAAVAWVPLAMAAALFAVFAACGDNLRAGTDDATGGDSGGDGAGQVEVTAIALSETDISLPLGLSRRLTLTGTALTGETVDLTAAAAWSTTDSSVATADAGVVRALGQGTTAGQVEYGGFSAPFQVTVTGAGAASLVITLPSASVPVGHSVEAQAVITLTDGTMMDASDTVTWVSSNAGVASVDADGTVTGEGLGDASISATLGGVDASAAIAVTDAVIEQIDVTPPVVTLAATTETQLTATAVFSDGTSADVTDSVAWSSSNAAIATVDDGHVSATAAGNATITASAPGVDATAAVTVAGSPITGIGIEPILGGILPIGTHVGLTVTATLEDGTLVDVTDVVDLSTSVDAVVELGAAGDVFGVGPGTVTVTATLGDLHASIDLTVGAGLGALESIAITPSPVTLGLGVGTQLRATGRFANGTTADLTRSVLWRASDASVATVGTGLGTAGLVHGVGLGSATVTASFGAVSQATTVTVDEPPVALEIRGTDGLLGLGALTYLSAWATYADGRVVDVSSQVTWSATGIAVLVSNAPLTRGRLIAVAVGESTVTATLGTLGGDAVIGTSVTLRVGL